MMLDGETPMAGIIPSCWCCGAHQAGNDLVRLGAHPEVGICLDCAQWVGRRARARRDEQHPTPSGHLRRALSILREHVINRGWHERGSLGTLLRSIDRHLP